MGTADIKRVQFVGSALAHLFFCSTMSTPQEKSNVTVTPVPDITLVSDSKDEDIVDLEAVAREATAKLEKDLVDAKVQNEGIAQKKQERANRQAAVKKKKEDKEVVEAKQKLESGQGSQEKGSSATSGKFHLPAFIGWKLTWFPVWAGRSSRKRNGRAVQMQGEWVSKL